MISTRQQLLSLLGQLVSVTDPGGDGASGYLESVSDPEVREKQLGSWAVFDWGRMWFVTDYTTVEPVTDPDERQHHRTGKYLDAIANADVPLSLQQRQAITAAVLVIADHEIKQAKQAKQGPQWRTEYTEQNRDQLLKTDNPEPGEDEVTETEQLLKQAGLLDPPKKKDPR